MPVGQARRLCPHAIFLPGRFEVYGEVSRRFMEILQSYTPFLQPLGLDEAYMDMTGFEALYGPHAQTAAAIKARVRGELGVTASVGIADSKVAAKVASDACKPDGLLEVPPGEDAAFLAPLPVEKIPGVGPKATQALQEMGVRTVAELAAVAAAVLRASFGAWGDLLPLWAHGQDDGEVAAPALPKSIGRSTTFPKDTSDRPYLKGVLRYLAELVGAELRGEGLQARVVALTLRWADFTTLSRHQTLAQPTDTDRAIYSEGLRLLERELEAEARGAGRPVRLLGVAVGGLAPAPPQLLLLGEEPGRRLCRATDAVRARYGFSAIQTASCSAVSPEAIPYRLKPFARRLPRQPAPSPSSSHLS
jgi:DNA polymerase-4